MARPITNTSHSAQIKREQMRLLREAMKARPVPVNFKPLIEAVNHWRAQ